MTKSKRLYRIVNATASGIYIYIYIVTTGLKNFGKSVFVMNSVFRKCGFSAETFKMKVRHKRELYMHRAYF